MTTQPTQPENNDTQVTVVEDSPAPNAPSNDGAVEVPASTQVEDNPISLPAPEAPALSFTALIEEFRQREERMAAHSAAPGEEQAAEARGEDPQGTDRIGAGLAPALDNPQDAEPGTTGNAEAAPVNKPPRLVPPPLRPATRIRMPRQGGGRGRETFVTQASAPAPAAGPAPIASTHTQDTEYQAAAGVQTPLTSQEAPTPVVEAGEETATGAAQEAHVGEAEQPKPARRYRFDRREPVARPTIPSKPVSLAPSAGEPAAMRVRQEQAAPEHSTKPTDGSPVEASAAAEITPTVPEPAAAPESEVTAPAAQATRQHNDRRRRHGQEGQQARAQAPGEAKDAGKTDATRQAEAVKVDAMNRVPTGAAEQPVTETPVDAIPL